MIYIIRAFARFGSDYISHYVASIPPQGERFGFIAMTIPCIPKLLLRITAAA